MAQIEPVNPALDLRPVVGHDSANFPEFVHDSDEAIPAERVSESRSPGGPPVLIGDDGDADLDPVPEEMRGPDADVRFEQLAGSDPELASLEPVRQ